MSDETKITLDNIVELSQFKIGDTVTLMKTIVNDVDIFEVGRTMKVKKIINHSVFKLPDKSFEEFKNKFKVDEKIFTLLLIDDETGASVTCNAYHVIKGIATKSQIDTVINHRTKQSDKRRFIITFPFLLPVVIFIVPYIFFTEVLHNTIYEYLLGIFAIVGLLVSGVLGIKMGKPFTKIKRKSKQRGINNVR